MIGQYLQRHPVYTIGEVAQAVCDIIERGDALLAGEPAAPPPPPAAACRPRNLRPAANRRTAFPGPSGNQRPGRAVLRSRSRPPAGIYKQAGRCRRPILRSGGLRPTQQ